KLTVSREFPARRRVQLFPKEGQWRPHHRGNVQFGGPDRAAGPSNPSAAKETVCPEIIHTHSMMALEKEPRKALLYQDRQHRKPDSAT
ncbi:hypothetical protein ATANTOWER_014794, partial [Ataeniobius toweri]|nr:hypothetical protein [Ataeniobius toweri]